jgi:predicted O-methyltransferase YrrM
MNLKRLLKKIPYFEKSYSILHNLPKYYSNKIVLKQVSDAHNLQVSNMREVIYQLKSGLSSLSKSERYAMKNIEKERKRLLSINRPLIDGSFGGSGLYDKDMTIRRACEASKPPKPALMLYFLTRKLHPKNVIELGTNVGISSSYIGTALKFNGSGKLVTLDVSAYRQRLAKEVHNNIEINNTTFVDGLFSETLSDVLEKMDSVDLVFIDGHHQYKPTLDYFEKTLKYANNKTVFVFDDIRWTDGMKRAWEEIRNDERLGIVLDFHSVGVCMLRQKETSERFVFDPIYIL